MNYEEISREIMFTGDGPVDKFVITYRAVHLATRRPDLAGDITEFLYDLFAEDSQEDLY